MQDKYFKASELGLILVTICTATIFVSGCNFPDSNSRGTEAGETTDGVVSYLTSSDKRLLNDRQSPITFSDAEANIVIEVDANQRMQSITGFGAAMTGSSAYLLRQMEADERRALLIDVFDPDEGIGISNIRLTIGSSDFSLGSSYSYWDAPGLENFAIPEIDRRDVIPVMQEILTINPELWIMASPWSAPGWMKTTGDMHGGQLMSHHFEDFSQYLKMFVQAYEKQGIPIHALTVQNEPLHETPGYPTMYMPWHDQNVLIRDFIGPLFESEGIDTEIIVFDHNWEDYQYPINILNDKETRQYVSGSAFHGYDGEVSQMSKVFDAHPDKALYFTEISGGRWATDFMANIDWNIKHIFLGSLRQNSKNALFWNLALNEEDGPQNGGCTNCRGVVTIPEDGSELVRNEEYYVLAHVARHVRPGDHRIFSSPKQADLNYMAFANDDGDHKMVIMNSAHDDRTFQVTSGKGRFLYTLPKRTIGTLLW